MSHRSRWLAFLTIVAVLTLLRLPANGETPAEYDRALSQVQAALTRQIQALQHGSPLPAAQSPAAVATRLLSPIGAVERTGSPPEPVDDSLLLETLRTAGSAGDVKHRIVRSRETIVQIAALRRDVAGAGHADGATHTAEKDARAVLSSRIYSFDPMPPPSAMERVAEWLDRTLKRLFHHRTGPSPAMPNISLGFVKGLVIVLVAGAFALLVAVLVRWLRLRPARVPPLSLDETEAALVEARDTDSLRALAEQKAQGGDYRLALRLIYLALLVALDTGGVLRFDRSKTNWEYLRGLRASGRSDVHEAMTPLTREFDRIWYGFATADAADYARALTQYDALQAAAKASSAPPRPTVAA